MQGVICLIVIIVIKKALKNVSIKKQGHIFLDKFQGTYGTQCKPSLTGIGRSYGRFFHCDLTKGKLISEFFIYNVHNRVFHKLFQCLNQANATHSTNARSFFPVIDRNCLTSVLSLYNPGFTSTFILLKTDLSKNCVLDCISDHSIEFSHFSWNILHCKDHNLSGIGIVFLDFHPLLKGHYRVERGYPLFKGEPPLPPLHFKAHFPCSQFPEPMPKRA